MRRIALGFLFCSLWSATSAVAQSPLCEPRFWASTTQRSVEIMLQRGDDPAAPCPNSRDGDTPLHLAAVSANDAGAVRALAAAGGDMTLRNAVGATAFELFMRRYEAHVGGGGAEDPTLAALQTLFLSGADPATRQQWRMALDRALAPQPSAPSATPAGVGGGGGPGVDPFAALDQAFAGEAGAEDGEEEAAAGLADPEPGVAPVEDPFAALDRAFAAEADARADPVGANGSGIAALAVPADTETGVDTAAAEGGRARGSRRVGACGECKPDRCRDGCGGGPGIRRGRGKLVRADGGLRGCPRPSDPRAGARRGADGRRVAAVVRDERRRRGSVCRAGRALGVGAHARSGLRVHRAAALKARQVGLR